MKQLLFTMTLVAALSGAARADDGTVPPLDRFLGDLLGAIDPWLRDLSELLGDLSGWHAPEVLPNGDILIRRRRAEDQPPAAPADDAPLEL